MDKKEPNSNGADGDMNDLATGSVAVAGTPGSTATVPEAVAAIPEPTKSATPQRTGTRKKRGRKGKSKRRASKPGSAKDESATKGRRTFPASTFDEALVIPQAIQQFASGQKIRRLTLFNNLNKSPDSGPSRQLVTNSNKYGLTKGNYASEWLELTPEGAVATNPDGALDERLRARFKLAIERIPQFASLYQQYKGNKLPAQSVMRDHLTEQGFGSDVSECVDTFILNAKDLGLLRPFAGAERILPVEQVIEDLPKSEASRTAPLQGPLVTDGGGVTTPAPNADWSKICFYVTPIGEPDSEQRRHSDLFLSSIVEPAMAEFGLTVVRADNIGKPGMITAQVIQHVINAKLVIADLSFHNPNVFYELCLRHACRLPTVQLIRAADSIPFDLDQFRTITIDTTDIYSLVPQLETYRSEIATHARRALNDPDAVDNPLTIFCPGLSVSFVASSVG